MAIYKQFILTQVEFSMIYTKLLNHFDFIFLSKVLSICCTSCRGTLLVWEDFIAQLPDLNVKLVISNPKHPFAQVYLV